MTNPYKPRLADHFWKRMSAPYKTPAALEDALHEAAVTNNLWRAHYLLTQYKVDANANSGRALRWAARSGHDEMSALLIAHGADVNANDGEALFWAMTFGRDKAVHLLIDKGTDLTLQDYKAVWRAAADKNRPLLAKMFSTPQNLVPVAEKLLVLATQNKDAEMARLYRDYLDSKHIKPATPNPKP